MTRYILFAFICFGLFSCNEADINPNSLDGHYKGEFTISSSTGSQTSQVDLNFESGTFTGTSSNNKLPALGTGAFRLQGSDIQFTNASFWTADFDWNLILDGAYKIKTTSNTITLTREINQVTYHYELTKSE